MDGYLIAAPAVDVSSTVLPVIRDATGAFARVYGKAGDAVYVVRPDGYLGFASTDLTGSGIQALVGYLCNTFAPAEAGQPHLRP